MSRIPTSCPKCKSKKYRVISKKKHREGFSVSKAIVGGVLFGAAGSIIGGGSGNKKYIITMRCSDCGYEEEYEG